jgi:hypothetical protein
MALFTELRNLGMYNNNKQKAGWKVYCTVFIHLWGIMKLTRLFYGTSQLLNKNRTCALSMK